MENETIQTEDVVEEKNLFDDDLATVVTETVISEELIPTPKPESRFKKMFTVKRIIIAVIIIVVLVGAYLGRSLVIAATVNGTIISRLEVIKNLEKQDGKVALTSMINERLINMEADNRKITVSADEVKTEVDKIEKQLVGQGTTLDAALAEQNLTRKEIEKRIVTQKELEKMLADKIAVTDVEVEKYIKDNSITLTKGKEAEEKANISDQLKSTKLNTEAKTFVDGLNAKANIKHFVNY